MRVRGGRDGAHRQAADHVDGAHALGRDEGLGLLPHGALVDGPARQQQYVGAAGVGALDDVAHGIMLCVDEPLGPGLLGDSIDAVGHRVVVDEDVEATVRLVLLQHLESHAEVAVLVSGTRAHGAGVDALAEGYLGLVADGHSLAVSIRELDGLAFGCALERACFDGSLHGGKSAPIPRFGEDASSTATMGSPAGLGRGSCSGRRGGYLGEDVTGSLLVGADLLTCCSHC